MFNGKTHYKWPFSKAMLVYQRVMLNTPGNSVVVIQFRKVQMVHIIGTMGSGTMTVLAVCKGTTTQ